VYFPTILLLYKGLDAGEKGVLIIGHRYAVGTVKNKLKILHELYVISVVHTEDLYSSTAQPCQG